MLQLSVCSKVGALESANAEAAVASDSAAQRLLSAQQKRRLKVWQLTVEAVCVLGLSVLAFSSWLFSCVWVRQVDLRGLDVCVV